MQTALLRRYFLEITQTFIIPLERYLASLMPLARTISPYRAPPKVKPFNCEDFIKSVETAGPGPHLTTGDWQGSNNQPDISIISPLDWGGQTGATANQYLILHN